MFQYLDALGRGISPFELLLCLFGVPFWQLYGTAPMVNHPIGVDDVKFNANCHFSCRIDEFLPHKCLADNKKNVKELAADHL